jgi:hypothetical protein
MRRSWLLGALACFLAVSAPARATLNCEQVDTSIFDTAQPITPHALGSDNKAHCDRGEILINMQDSNGNAISNCYALNCGLGAQLCKSVATGAFPTYECVRRRLIWKIFYF